MPDDNTPLDAPLTDPKDDLLERDGFAQLIAKAILRPTNGGATTYALCGGWGSGKSTVANFVEHHIGEEADVIRFEPWMVGTSEALARELFLEIARKAFKDRNGKEDLELRRAYYGYVSSILESVGVAGTALATLSDHKPGLFVLAVGFFKSLFKGSSEGLEQLGKADTLQRRRDTIKINLAHLKKPIVMIVDDVDRLEPEEIRTLFRVVKACADFPNVCYLLLFDRPQVSRALGKEEQGEEFLEKIVNVMFDLPPIGDKDRMKILREALEPIARHATELEAKQRLDEVFEKVLQPGLTTIRMAKRFAVAAEALASGMEDDKGANYDPADFLLLEFLRSKALSVYEAVASYRFDPVEAAMKKYRSAEVPGTPWSQNLRAKINETGNAKDVVKQAVRLLRPDLNIETGDAETSGFAGVLTTKRFFDPVWQGVYLGCDSARAPLREEQWQEFLERLEGPDADVLLPSGFTNGARQAEVGRAITFRLQSLSGTALRRLIVAALKWGEGKIEDEPTLGWMDFRESSLGADLALHGLHEFWQRGENALDLLDELATMSSAPIMRVALLEDVSLALKRSNNDFWGPRIEGECRFKEEVNKVQARIDDKTIWEQRGAQRLMEAWRFAVGAEVYNPWYKQAHQDSALMRAYLEHACPMPSDAGTLGELDGPDDFVRTVLALSPDQLGERGREIQRQYQTRVEQVRAAKIRVDRMRLP